MSVVGPSLLWTFALLNVVVAASATSSSSNDATTASRGQGTPQLLLPHSYEVSVRLVGRHVCAGAIIGPKHVLTAAHCFHQTPAKKYPEPMLAYMSVRAGINGNLSAEGHEHRIKNVTTHRDMSEATREFWISDVALVTLETEISYSALEQPIDLADGDASESARAQMSVWTSPVESLQITEVYLISHGKCKERLKEKFLGEHEKKICGYTRAGRGFCLKNDGSPLVQNGKLIGIASKSEGCFNGSPDIYVSVYRNVDFINRAIALHDFKKFTVS